MLPLAEYKQISLPNYKYTNILSKQSLYKYCMESPAIKAYLPEDLKSTGVERDFFLRVILAIL